MKLSLLIFLLTSNLFAQAYDEDGLASFFSQKITSANAEAPEGFKNCDSQTYVNLEEEQPFKGAKFKGPFYQVPRDNQDGIGTCHATAGKNFLVGLSGGKDIASFLDLALISKDESGELIKKGLEGGKICQVLEAAKTRGYCPQKFAPLETGSRNYASESLFGLDPLRSVAFSISQLKGFLEDLETLKDSHSALKAEILDNSKSLIEKLKQNPDIKFPMPVVRVDILIEWKLRDLYKKASMQKKPSEEQFVSEYKEAYQKFKPSYLNAVVKGKSADQVFDLYTKSLSPWIAKYGLESELPEMKRLFKADANSDFKDPKYKQQLRATIDFVKQITNKNDQSDENFYEFCMSDEPEIKLLNNLLPLVKKIREGKMNGNLLVDANGKFRSTMEIMQLTVAPSCLNSQNRKSIPDFTCTNDFNDIRKLKNSGKPLTEQIKVVREKVVAGLYQGLPLGNTLRLSPTSNDTHINTIVGIRYSKQNKCEYLIRDSADATSTWQSEEKIFDQMHVLGEVRKR
jgi:hypothetical protein